MTLSNNTVELTLLEGGVGSFMHKGWPVIPAGVKPYGSYILAPFSNRLTGGFWFEQQWYPMQHNWGGEIIHGEVIAQPFDTLEQSANHAVLLNHYTPQEGRYPFAFDTQTSYKLLANGFEQTVVLTNRHTAAIPAGLGVHPFFNTLRNGTDVQVQFAASSIYDTDASCIPQVPAVAIPESLDFSEPKGIKHRHIDHVYAGYQQQAVLHWPDAQVVIKSSNANFFVMYNGLDGHVALEPVTHATNAFNMHAVGWENTGIRILQPQESMTLTWSVEVTTL